MTAAPHPGYSEMEEKHDIGRYKVHVEYTPKTFEERMHQNLYIV